MPIDRDIDLAPKSVATGGVRMPVLSTAQRSPTGTGDFAEVPGHHAVWDDEGRCLHQPTDGAETLRAHGELLRAAADIVATELGEEVVHAECTDVQDRHCMHPLRGGCAIGPVHLSSPEQERERRRAQALLDALRRTP